MKHNKGRNVKGHPDVLWIDEANIAVVLEDVFEGEGVKYLRSDTVPKPTDSTTLHNIQEGLLHAYETGDPITLWDYVEKQLQNTA